MAMSDTVKRKIIDELTIEDVTGYVTLSYPKLTEPDTKWKPEGEWVAKSIMPAEAAKSLVATIDALQKEAHDRFLAEEQRDKPKLKSLKLADPSYKIVEDDEGDETGEYSFNFKLKASHYSKKKEKTYHFTFRLQDAKGNPIKVGSLEIWGGTVARISYKLSPFYNTALGVGVKLELRGVRIIELVTRGDNSDLGFGDEEEDGGFEFDAAMAAQAASEPAADEEENDSDNEEASDGGAQEGTDEEDF
jgi:hypothetical protein